jgi:hypothetical protein
MVKVKVKKRLRAGIVEHSRCPISAQVFLVESRPVEWLLVEWTMVE